MARVSTFIQTTMAFVLASVPTFALAVPNQRPDRIVAPELDPSSAAAVVVLLVGVALIAHRRVARA